MVNMNLDLEENWDAKHKLYETSNMGMVLEPKSLRIEKWLAWHWVFLVGIGARRKVWIKDSQKHLGYIRRRSLMMGIKPDVYPRKGVIHAFQMPSII